MFGTSPLQENSPPISLSPVAQVNLSVLHRGLGLILSPPPCCLSTHYYTRQDKSSGPTESGPGIVSSLPAWGKVCLSSFAEIEKDTSLVPGIERKKVMCCRGD